MKKIIAVLLTLVLLAVSLVGCGKKETDSDGKKGGITWQTASGDSTFTGNTGTTSGDKNPASSQSSGGNTTNNNSSSGGNNTNNSNQNNNNQNGSSGGSSKPNINIEVEYDDGIITDISGTGLTSHGVETITKTYNIVSSEYNLKDFKRYTYTASNGKKMCYSLRLPLNYDQSKQYPVLMFLHGINNSGSDWNTTEHLHSLFAENGDIINKVIMISPQAIDSGDLWAATPGGNGDIAYQLLQQVVADYNADKNRIYVMGLSMGGIGTWNIIEQHPEYFAAASPICGVGNTMAASKLVNLPIWGWHGTKDETVAYDWWGSTPKMYDAIKAAGGKNMIFSKLEGVGHDAWTPAFSSREHMSWMISQIKGKHQSAEYTMLPYLTVVDANGNVVISEFDATAVSTREGSGRVANKRDIVLTLTKDATKKLSDAYKKSGGKEFSIYFGNQKIVSFTATKETTGRMLVIRDVFAENAYRVYYSKLLKTVGKK